MSDTDPCSDDEGPSDDLMRVIYINRGDEWTPAAAVAPAAERLL